MWAMVLGGTLLAASTVRAASAGADPVGNAAGVLADPVIEEPLRPLFPGADAVVDAMAPRACGPSDALPLAGLSLLGLQLLPVRRSRCVRSDRRW
jgi:hypothetical protein